VKRIVADSGPLIMFARSSLLTVLRDVAGDVILPEIIFAECCRDPTKAGAAILTKAKKDGRVQVEADPDESVVAGFRKIANLDAGEMSVLALSAAMKCPALMDERLGRAVAKLNNIPVVGSAGILIAAKQRGFIQEVGPVLNAWRGWGYFLAPALLEAVLTRAGEIAV
jgi:predicted nucleic acid-binding protein